MGESLWNKIIERTFGFPLYRSPEDILRSYFISPKLLFVWRCFALLWVLAVMLAQWIHYIGTGMEYFTYMSYMVLLFYFFLTVILSFMRKAWRLHRPWEHASEHIEPSSVHLDRFCKFIILVGEIIVVNECVVVIVYWALLSGGSYNQLETYININVHALSWPFIWFDYAMNTIPFHYSHVLYTLLSLLGYMFFAWVYEYQFREWIYFFLDYYADAAPLFYIGLLVGFVVLYYVVFGVIVLRNKIYHYIHPEEKVVKLTVLNGEDA